MDYINKRTRNTAFAGDLNGFVLTSNQSWSVLRVRLPQIMLFLLDVKQLTEKIERDIGNQL